MEKIIAWFVEKTKVGQMLVKTRDFLDGKKQAIAGLGTGVAGTITIIMGFIDKGTPYLLHVASTPEFIAASGGFIAFFNALKGEKIRAEIEDKK